MTAFPFLLAVLATLGGAFALAVEDVSEPFRQWLQRQGWSWVEDGDEYVTPDGGHWVPKAGEGVWRWLSSLFSCPFCTGFYCAFFATLVVAGHPTTWLWFLIWWAVWGAHIVLASVVLLVRKAMDSLPG